MGITNGIIFPVTIVGGELYSPSLEESIISSVRVILSWEHGTRYFNTKFGASLYKQLYEPNDQVSDTVIKVLITKAIGIHEPRITLKSVDLKRDGERIYINIYATVNETQSDITINING